MELIERKHSKLGITSCIVAFAVWVYFAVAVYLVFYVEGVTKWLNDNFTPESRGISDFRGLGTAIVVFAVIFFIIPLAGHFLGLLFGVVGLISRKTKNLLPVAGIALNLLPGLILTILWVIGSLASS
ncbi:MAG TPA: hypothetical protein PKA82_13200 [Pyrinomonadaceae bacterium]|nr:hypothetical protein [Pyrinomonadaceae bacterium]